MEWGCVHVDVDGMGRGSGTEGRETKRLGPAGPTIQKRSSRNIDKGDPAWIRNVNANGRLKNSLINSPIRHFLTHIDPPNSPEIGELESRMASPRTACQLLTYISSLYTQLKNASPKTPPG